MTDQDMLIQTIILIKSLIDIDDSISTAKLKINDLEEHRTSLENSYIHSFSKLKKQWGENPIFIDETRQKIKLSNPRFEVSQKGIKIQPIADIRWTATNLTLKRVDVFMREHDVISLLEKGVLIPWTEKEWVLPHTINFSDIKMKEERIQYKIIKPRMPLSLYYGATAKGRIIVFTGVFISDLKNNNPNKNQYYLKKNNKNYILRRAGLKEESLTSVNLMKVYLNKEEFVADNI